MSINPELSERHAYLDSIVAETVQNLANNDGVQRTMGEATRQRLLSDAEGLFVPNFRDGVLSIPDEYRDHGTPIVALRRDETVVLGEGFGMMTPNQEETLRGTLEEWKEKSAGALAVTGSQVADALRSGEGRQVLPRVGQGMNARVGNIAVGMVIGRAETASQLVAARPVLVFYPDRDQAFTPQPSSTTKAVHELVHVGQSNKQPVLDAAPDVLRRSVVSSELQAYQGEVAYTGGLVTSSDPQYSGNMTIASPAAFRVAQLRKEHAADGASPFEANDAIVEALEREGLIDMLLPESAR